MTSKQNQTALITGASGGIGLELAKLFARDGHNLVLVARSKEKLEKLAAELEQSGGISVRVMVADLAKPDAPQQIVDQLERERIQIDFLVNNAGYGLNGKFIELKRSEQLEMIQLNVMSLVHLTHLLLPGMLERKQGRIMQVASTAGFLPGPLMAVYYATKAFVVSFSQALANELEGTGVTVTCLCPGATVTGFAERAGMQGSKLFKTAAMDVVPVVEEGYRGMMKGKTVVITGLRNKIMMQSLRLSPRKMTAKIARGLQETRKKS